LSKLEHRIKGEGRERVTSSLMFRRILSLNPQTTKKSPRHRVYLMFFQRRLGKKRRYVALEKEMTLFLSRSREGEEFDLDSNKWEEIQG